MRTRIKYNGRHVELGSYRDEAYAAAVYNYAAQILFGEFRRENVGDAIPKALTSSDMKKIEMKCEKHLQFFE